MDKKGDTGTFRGNVRRLSPKAHSSEYQIKKSISEQALVKWSRRQDYHSYYTKMIDLELEDEMKNIDERLKTWSNRRLEDAGLVLFKLKGRTSGWLFNERILTFQADNGQELPWHKFGQGDIVTISRKRPWTEIVTEGTVLDRSRKRIRVVVSEPPEDLRRGTWRLDRAANRIAHDRMAEALDSFALNEFSPTPLDDILLASLHDLVASSEMPPEIPKTKRVPPNIDISKLKLNQSQSEAVIGALTRRLTLIQGPPGTGKTSIGQSIAKSLGRKFYRFSLGGMRDEAEIKGHRRTYIGALPGKFINAIKTCKTSNPVIMLDEIDKIGASFQGDPASALLEVLDPEQNKDFLDHYLDVRFDLSKVLFICTANQQDTIPGPLLDRMEVIRLSGYILEEKLQIARRHLIERQLSSHGLKPEEFQIDDNTLREVIDGYAREAGVRNLEKQLKKMMRKATRHIVTERGKENPKTEVQINKEDLKEYLGKRLSLIHI